MLLHGSECLKKILEFKSINGSYGTINMSQCELSQFLLTNSKSATDAMTVLVSVLTVSI